MTPGRYVARAVVSRDGATVKTLTRPITIVRDTSVVTKATTRPRGVPISALLKERTAGYIAGVVNGLANVVAQEDFTLSKPDRRVTSDLLLVRYPGTRRDLIPYRDVSQLNGKVIEGREKRLVELFLKPTDAVREQARQIMSSADAYVPSAFNPMFVLGFLQSEFQSRFELTVNDAGSEWPREVKAVTFVEVGRPTLLRTGPFGDIDAPTRGTAWIEEGTGRILQTELQVGRGRGDSDDGHEVQARREAAGHGAGGNADGRSRGSSDLQQLPSFRRGNGYSYPGAASAAELIQFDATTPRVRPARDIGARW